MEEYPQELQELKSSGKVFAFNRLETVKFSSVTNDFINKAMKIEILNKRGFTLVELLVVISIIALLSTIAIVSLGSARAKARDTARIADMKQLATALEQYYADNGGYPAVQAVGTYPDWTKTIVIGKITSPVTNTLTSNNAAYSGIAAGTGSFGNGTGATTTYMGNIPAYPTPGKTGATADCSAMGAAFCYTSDTAWATAATYAGNYTMWWQLEAKNTALNGSNCTTTSSGVTCS